MPHRLGEKKKKKRCVCGRWIYLCSGQEELPFKNPSAFVLAPLNTILHYSQKSSLRGGKGPRLSVHRSVGTV